MTIDRWFLFICWIIGNIIVFILSFWLEVYGFLFGFVLGQSYLMLFYQGYRRLKDEERIENIQ